jgi:hypothetical protein
VEGFAATDGLGLLSVGLLVGHAAPDAATGSVIVREMASISMRISTSEPLLSRREQHNDSISALFEEKGPALFLKRRSTSPFKNRQLNAAISPPFFFQYLSVLHLGKAGRLFREKAVRGKGGERAVKGR